jgi:ketosteroid isomerase-like protein
MVARRPSGYLEIMAPDVTVFDASTERRVDGIAAAKAHYEPVRGKVKIARYDLIDPSVQVIGNVPILTFRFVSYNTAGAVTSRWNVTEVYRHARWRIVQSHASHTRGRPADIQ